MMEKENLIPVYDFCTSHKIEISFINSLKDEGLIELVRIEETEYLHDNQLNDLEKIIRLHNDLDINIEGIDTVIHLLDKIHEMQDEILRLRNRLRLYEDI